VPDEIGNRRPQIGCFSASGGWPRATPEIGDQNVSQRLGTARNHAGGTGLASSPITRRATMRILTFRRMFAIAAIGVAYVHGKRGGDATFASISDTMRYLWSSMAPRLGLEGRSQQRSQSQQQPQRSGMSSGTSAGMSSGTSSGTSPSKTGAPNGLPGERFPRPQGGG
jgi:hypothetical protein